MAHSARYNITTPRILRLVVTLRAKKTQKSVLRPALRPNQISFSHSLGPLPTSACTAVCQQLAKGDVQVSRRLALAGIDLD